MILYMSIFPDMSNTLGSLCEKIFRINQTEDVALNMNTNITRHDDLSI